MSFTSPLFLIGLLAVAVPIVVHLFNFRRYKKVYFSNVDKLEQLQSETRRQSTLRQLLILAARVLAIVFLVLAFARPVLKGDNSIRPGANDVSIFIDNSFSMESTDGSSTLLDLAKVKAREIVSAYAPGDRFQLMTCDIEGRQFHWLSKDEMLTMIDEVQITGATAHISDIASRQADFLRGGHGANRLAYIVSDFQSSAFDSETFPTDSTIDVTFVPLSSVSADNIYIDSLALGSPTVHKGSGVTLSVWLCNEGDENVDKVPVSLYVNNKQRALVTVDLPAHASSMAELHFVVDETGVLSGRIETEDYPVIFDNSFYFSLFVCDRVNCLLVEGKGNNDFLSSLLDGDSLLNLHTMPLRQMDFSNLDANDFVLLDELPSITTGMAQTLLDFVRQGGSLAVVMPDDADKESYNAALSLFSAPQIVGKHEGRSTAARVNMESSLYRNVFNGKNADMELPSVSGYYQFQSSAGTLAESIISFAGGGDYVCHTPCGDGHLYIVAAPLRDASTDFIRQALFVPTIYNMALFSVRPSLPYAMLGEEQSIPLTARYAADAATLRLKKPDGQDDDEVIPDIRTTGGISRLVTHDAPKEAGNYLLTLDGTAMEGLSFNYLRSESKMRFYNKSELEKMMRDAGVEGVSVVPSPDKPLDKYLQDRMEGRGLWRWCIILCLLMLLTEIVLVRTANRSTY